MPNSYAHPLASIGIECFYREYWQRKPLFIKQALPSIALPIEANELAGLSCEEEVTSRIVTGTWELMDFKVEHGPITESRYEDIGESDWTLLVQDVDKIIPEAKNLLDLFDFLPSWRIDDLMISFASEGGSVGPHIDEYDVFLIQLEGTRRWQIAEQFSPELCPDLDLKVLKHFTSEQEWVCEPGDLLYLPPNIAHYGLALEPCMTASVGLRAPSLADLLDDLANDWAERESVPRYRDAGMKMPQDHWQMDDAAVERFRQLLAQLSTLPEREFKTWLGACMSRYRLAQQLLEDGPISSEARASAQLENTHCSLNDLIAQFPTAFRQGAARLHWLGLNESPGRALLCANGEAFETDTEIAKKLCRCDQFQAQEMPDHALLSFLLNSGAFVLDKA